ncbi:glycoside hydrolase family 15 protein [Rathayibacter sp. YIM 133350]|uniref:glycoside hydrolase family 15 protein n=1 Tax=Rathayibacter sp. YIM 133350 TaxID=3131992 RepID=UPI00307E79CB
MTQPIEDYALLSNSRTCALVGKDGSIDWLCLPRFDSPSAFGALLGTPDHGRWLLRPEDPDATLERHYLTDTFTVVNTWTTKEGVVEVLDTMPRTRGHIDVLRQVRGIRGTVPMRQEIRIRFAYASALPWVRQIEEDGSPALLAVCGPDAIIVRGPRLNARNHLHESLFSVGEGEVQRISLSWFPSNEQAPPRPDGDSAFIASGQWWSNWAATCEHDGPYRDQVVRSLLVLRALTHEETGGIVAAATTSLPEQLGGPRNWDYRYVWLRDASLTLQALLAHGYSEEAMTWREWLLRTIAGDPADVQIMYGVAGERYIPEREIASLPGYADSRPVRVGNAAVDQYQADVIGEVMVALHEARKAGVIDTQFSWPLQRALIGFVESNVARKDQGLWEMRGEPHYFTHSRVMMWAALDRAIMASAEFSVPGPRERWKTLREQLRTEIDAKGVDPVRGCFVQYYGTTEVDASLLLLPEVGYCAFDDPRMLATVAAIESDLMNDGLVHRYRTEANVDGLPPGEFPFLACSFWLVRQYAKTARLSEARALMDRLVGYCSDLGLLAEEIDPATGAHVGNYPQAFSHLALVGAADAIAEAEQQGR